MTSPSEAQSLRDAVALDAEPPLVNGAFGDISPIVLGWIIRHVIRDTGPIGAHIAKIEAERDELKFQVGLHDIEKWVFDLDTRADVQRRRADTAEAQVATLTARIADLGAALEQSRVTNRDLHRRAQKAEAFRGRHAADMTRMIKRYLLAQRNLRAARSVLSNKDAGHE